MSSKHYTSQVPATMYSRQLLAPPESALSRSNHAPTEKKDSPFIPLALCLLVALVLRAWLAIHTQGFIDGDEAVVGIQAEHILHGELPVYFYNQAYMGSLEAYLMAIIFAIVGPSVWALRAEPILLSLAIVWITWKLAAELADAAHLPQHARRWFMNLSALLAAITPLYDTVLELRALGGYVEAFLLMLLLLLSTLKLTRRRAAGASWGELVLRWAGIGFIAGLGIWVNPIIIYALLAAALWIMWDFFQLRKLANGLKQFATLVSHNVLPAIAALPACIAGLTPAIIWGATHSWQNFTYLLQLSGNTPLRTEIRAAYPTRVSISLGLTRLYATCVAPRVIGGALPGESPLLAILHAPALLLGVSCILVTTGLVALSFARPRPLLLRVRRLAGLPLLFAACCAFIFCVTKTAAIGLWSCNYDLAGRYATPLMLVLPFFCATVFVTVGATLVVARSEMGDPCGRPFQNSQEEHRRSMLRSRFPLQQTVLGTLVGVLLLGLYMQVISYGLTNAGSTFQSPYCTWAPLNDDPIIAYMQREHIHYGWASNWIAYAIVFKTQGNIILADPMPFITGNQVLDRIPANSEAVRQSDRPSLVTFVRHTDHYPQILRLLDSEHVTYKSARFPAEDGRDVMVVTPISRTVSPFEPGPFYNIFACSRDG